MLLGKKQRHPLLPVFLTYFLDNFGLAIIYPIFTPLFLKTTNSILAYATPYFERTLLLGIVVGSFPLAQFFGAPLIGQFSDRFGRKRAFYITILGTAFGYFLTAISILSESLLLLLMSRFFTGLFAGNLTLCLAAVADMSPDDDSRSKNFGQIAAIGGLSFIIAIAFGGILSDPTINKHFNPSLPFWITSFLSFLNFGCMVALFHETHPAQKHPGFNPLHGLHNLKEAIRRHELRAIYFVNFLFMLAWVASMQFLPTYLFEHFNFAMGSITLTLMGIGLLWSFCNLVINPLLAKKYFPGKTLLISLFFLAILLLSILFVHHFSTFFLLFFPAVCCASLCWTNGLATVSLKASSAIQGSILGINQAMTSVAALLSPILGGLLSGINEHALYFFAGLMTLFAFVILYRAKGYIERH
jgi:DHA1 family tetracycline resistance protein-like MFS transporter